MSRVCFIELEGFWHVASAVSEVESRKYWAQLGPISHIALSSIAASWRNAGEDRPGYAARLSSS